MKLQRRIAALTYLKSCINIISARGTGAKQHLYVCMFVNMCYMAWKPKYDESEGAASRLGCRGRWRQRMSAWQRGRVLLFHK